MESSTTETSETLPPAISMGSIKPTGLPGWAGGAAHSDSPELATTPPAGPAPVPANLTARQAEAAGLLTSGTYGPVGSGSSASAALQSSLVNRLRARLPLSGSILFRLIWKERVTPSGRRISALRASKHRTSDSDCGSWPTPAVTNADRGGDERRWKGEQSLGGRRSNLQDAVMATDSWATPTQRDYRSDRSRMTDEELYGSKGRPLARQALSAWPTTQSRDGAHSRSGQIERTGGRRRNLDDYVTLASGPPPTGSIVGTASTGQLSPAHSRWLMGYPPEWASCAPMATRSSRRSQPSSSQPTSKAA